MNLKDTIHRALDLTRDLEAALMKGDLDLSKTYLGKRHEAMHLFEQRHKASSESVRFECRADLAELFKADQDLQNLAQDILNKSQTEFRTNMGNSPLVGNSTYGRSESIGCVDRKA